MDTFVVNARSVVGDWLYNAIILFAPAITANCLTMSNSNSSSTLDVQLNLAFLGIVLVGPGSVKISSSARMYIPKTPSDVHYANCMRINGTMCVCKVLFILSILTVVTSCVSAKENEKDARKNIASIKVDSKCVHTKTGPAQSSSRWILSRQLRPLIAPHAKIRYMCDLSYGSSYRFGRNRKMLWKCDDNYTTAKTAESDQTPIDNDDAD